MKSILKVAALASLLAVAGCAGTLKAPSANVDAAKLPMVKAASANPPRSILYVGNSFMYYNNSLHGITSRLASGSVNGKEANHRATSLTISGSGIDWHDLESYLRPDGLGRYSFVGDNEVRFNPPGRQYDSVILMDCSQCPIHPKLQAIFYEYAKKHSETLRKHGSEPILFMSWAYSDIPAMTEELAAEYIKAGQQNNALVVPAGYAFANSVAKRPDVSLIIADKRHPSLAGTYLAACTVLASVYKINPIGSKYLAGLSPEVAKHLQTVAWETSQAFHAKHGRGSLK